MADGDDLETALDGLFATPPEDFVAARNGLVKALKGAGRKEDAAGVAALRKPHRLVWALNQLALAGDDALGPVLAAVDAVRGGDDMKASVAVLREAIAAAAGAAAGRLDPTRPTDRAELAAALNAVVTGAEAVDLLAAGRLTEVPPPDPFGLGPAPGAETPKAAARPKARGKTKTKAKPSNAKASKATPARREPPVDQLARRRAQKRRQAAAKALEAADRALTKAEEAVEDLVDDVEESERAVAEAEVALAAAQADLDEARRVADAATGRHTAAEAALSEARAAHATATAELRAAESDPALT